MASLVIDNETKQAPEVTTDETGYSSLSKFHSKNQIINNNNDDDNNNISHNIYIIIIINYNNNIIFYHYYYCSILVT